MSIESKALEDNNSNKIDDKEKRNLYLKSQNIIKNAKIEKYMQDREVIANEGLSFFGVLTGRNSLQIQRIENIKLKIELLQSQKIEDKNEYEITDILADLYSCAISELNGKFTNEMKSMYNKIKENYCDETVSDDEIYIRRCFLPFPCIKSVRSVVVMSSNVILDASPILIPVLINKSIKAASRMYSFKAKGVSIVGSISKQLRILLISVTVKVLGNFFSCLNLNLSFLNGEISIISLSMR